MADEERTAEALRLASLAQQYLGKGITEQDTKNAFVEPVLAMFGWPKHDLERVRAEYRPTSKYNPVDYALFDKAKPVMFVEAKALDVPIDEPKTVGQILSYATVADVQWGVITNGIRWDLYSVYARGVDISKKRLFSVELSDPDFCDWLDWIKPTRLDGNELDQLWRLLVAEREVRDAVTRLFRDRDDALVSLLAKHAGLEVPDVVMALNSLRPEFSSARMEDRLAVMRSGSRSPRPTTRSRAGVARKPGRGAAPSERKAIRTPQRSGGGLPHPEPWTKPERFWIGSREWEVRSWKDLLLATVEHLHQTEPEQYKKLFAEPSFQGRDRPYFTKKQDLVRTGVRIPGGFVEVNLSAIHIVRLVARMLDFVGIPEEAAGYELRQDDE